MKVPVTHLNLIIAWLWVILGFASGFALGLGFHDEKWLGGYASHKRRLYRLGHISFFGLALMNLMFYFTVRSFPAHSSLAITVAGWGFIGGAVSMPICCLIMAHQPKSRALFLIPVLSLITAGAFTLWEVIKL
ncbi:MAG: hypothetical protein JWQ71_1699 [Pedosphaera sp.]|nr:hypothetical protein [Pedosphaera sp.]